MLNVGAIGAQLQNNNNQILSSIYAEYNNDYITWKTLPRYKGITDKNKSSLNEIIIEDYDHIDKIDSKENFTLDLIKYLNKVKKDKCLILETKNTYYLFEETLNNSLNFWSSYCRNNTNFNLLSSMDSNFKNIAFINNLYLQFKKNNLMEIKKLHKTIQDNEKLLSQFNSKELNLMYRIFHAKELTFSLKDLIGSYNNSLNGLTVQIDKNFIIEDYEDLIYMQVYQTSIYYFYAKEYKNSLALLSYLIKNNSKNKDFYIYKKFSFMAELNPNEEMLELINSFVFMNSDFQFFKDYLFLRTATQSNYDIEKLINYYYRISNDNDWQTLELAMTVAMKLYSQNENHEALKFIENCCLSSLENSTDPIHLFRYGILLERNDKITESEMIIQKSIDISDGSYPYILNYLAYLWVDNNRNLDLAENMLLKAVKDSDYQDGAILDSLGWLYFRKNEMDKAEKWILQAYIMEPAEPEIIDHLSQIYSRQGRNKEAMFLDNKILLFHKDYFKLNEVLKRN